MNKTHIGHMQVNINPKNLGFYKDLMSFLGWSVLFEESFMVGLADDRGTSLWFAGATKEVNNDYDGIGMNHLAIAVDSQAEVDEAVAYLQAKGVKALFDTPRHRPDFCGSPTETYYQVMFESPDRVLFEVVYTGPLAK